MQRIAVFVDAGYFYARCTEALSGSTLPRRMIDLDEQMLVNELISDAEALAGVPGSLLRIYWYDGAALSGLSPEQIRISEVDNVKLRMGVINTFGQQKGVDALIVTDLIDLARNHAIDAAMLVSGDEDIRIAVTIAQTYGVRVHLLGIATSTGTAQSRALIREVDTKLTWDAATLSKFAKMRESLPLIADVDQGPPRNAVPDVATAEMKQPAILKENGQTTTVGVPLGTPAEDSTDAFIAINAAVGEFIRTLDAADRDDILLVFGTDKRFPMYHDRRLLGAVARTFRRKLSLEERRTMRNTALALLQASATNESMPPNA